MYVIVICVESVSKKKLVLAFLERQLSYITTISRKKIITLYQLQQVIVSIIFYVKSTLILFCHRLHLVCNTYIEMKLMCIIFSFQCWSRSYRSLYRDWCYASSNASHRQTWYRRIPRIHSAPTQLSHTDPRSIYFCSRCPPGGSVQKNGCAASPGNIQPFGGSFGLNNGLNRTASGQVIYFLPKKRKWKWQCDR